MLELLDTFDINYITKVKAPLCISTPCSSQRKAVEFEFWRYIFGNKHHNILKLLHTSKCKVNDADTKIKMCRCNFELDICNFDCKKKSYIVMDG